MYKTCSAIILLLAASSLARAHFPFILPHEKGTSAKVVFSDTLEPDANVNIENLAHTKSMVRDARGKESVIEWSKGDGFYSLAVPGSGNRVIYGVTDYGVLQKGDAKPFKLTYYPKAVIGSPTAKEAVIGNQPLEVVVIGGGKKVKFRVLTDGKP